MAGDEAIKESDIKKEKKISIKDLSDKDKFLFYLAEKTEGYVGSDIEGLCREAAMLALRKDLNVEKINKDNFEEAMAKVKPSVTKGDLEKYKKIEENYLRSAKAALESSAGYLG